MNSKAQAGMEFLMTYGWALILVVTVIGVLVFIVSSPVSDVTFRSSDPTKLMLKGASVLAGAVQIKLQNITGGKITITALTGDGYSGLIVNESSLPLEIGAGGEILIDGTGTTGTITITYTDYAGIERTATITGSGGEPSTPAAFDAGSGTQLDPFNIRDCAGLQRINDGNLGTYNQLTQSFSCSDIPNFNPIGSDFASSFNGNFDGQGFTISGLTIDRPAEDFIGMFGYTGAGASISNVGLIGINITGKHDAGGLVGTNWGTITNSYTTGNVTGTGIGAGGLVGSNFDTVTRSYSTVDVTGLDNVGGLVGGNSFELSNSYATGNVTGNRYYAGGLTGVNVGSIVNSYSTGNVSGNETVGGLVGRNVSTITNSYSTGNIVEGVWEVGGLVGDNWASVTNGYWYTNDSLLDCYDGGNTGCPNGESEDFASDFYSATHDVYVSASPWDFDAIWDSAGSYPTLQ